MAKVRLCLGATVNAIRIWIRINCAEWLIGITQLRTGNCVACSALVGCRCDVNAL